ncbi:hypothetical protein [Consotaella aegiceratis]|uniref:hypothetical protein n=1 Tax=Consotaella aegiceratis TaxID=3097961 RepID=UPI002F42D619
MTDKPSSEAPKSKRQQRLEEALKANLRRRKDQARARRQPDDGGSDEVPPAATRSCSQDD